MKETFTHKEAVEYIKESFKIHNTSEYIIDPRGIEGTEEEFIAYAEANGLKLVAKRLNHLTFSPVAAETVEVVNEYQARVNAAISKVVDAKNELAWETCPPNLGKLCNALDDNNDILEQLEIDWGTVQQTVAEMEQKRAEKEFRANRGELTEEEEAELEEMLEEIYNKITDMNAGEIIEEIANEEALEYVASWYEDGANAIVEEIYEKIEATKEAEAKAEEEEADAE